MISVTSLSRLIFGLELVYVLNPFVCSLYILVNFGLSAAWETCVSIQSQLVYLRA